MSDSSRRWLRQLEMIQKDTGSTLVTGVNASLSHPREMSTSRPCHQETKSMMSSDSSGLFGDEDCSVSVGITEIEFTKIRDSIGTSHYAPSSAFPTLGPLLSGISGLGQAANILQSSPSIRITEWIRESELEQKSQKAKHLTELSLQMQYSQPTATLPWTYRLDTIQF